MMDEVDEDWLIAYNKAHPDKKLSEDSFETIMWRLEAACQEKVPYLQNVRIHIMRMSETWYLQTCLSILIFINRISQTFQHLMNLPWSSMSSLTLVSDHRQDSFMNNGKSGG